MFRQDDILEKRGTYYIVKPTILAINLAANWLINTDSDNIIEIIKDLKQVNLEEKFIERFKDLDQIDKAKDIVAELWGPNSPFGIAEVLNTTWGSLLFRYVVEVNPISTAKTLDIAFGKMSKDEILKIDVGRRNLVWALEKLCFRRETFSIGARIMFSFAVSENESWGNNSTNQFIQFHQLFLSGTEASLDEKLEIIKWGLNKNDKEYTQIAIQALGRGLINDHYSRMGGPEKQGSSAPLKDYYPNWKEIKQYWEEVISILTELACSNDINSELAKEKIANSIRTLIRDNESDIVIDSIRKIIKVKGNLWTDALNSLKLTLGFEKQLPKEIIAKINDLIIELTPTDTKNQLILKITKPEWDTYEKDNEGNYIDKPKLNAEAFAEEIIKNNIPWTEYLQDLLIDEQRQGLNFGKKIGELTVNIEKLIEIAIQELKKVKKENQNPELIGGLILGAKSKEIARRIIDNFIFDIDLRQHAFYLTRVINPEYKDVAKLFVLIDDFGFSINQFMNFKYGRALDNLTDQEVLYLCERVSKYDNPGKWTSLSLLYMFCYNNDERWDTNKAFFRNLISSGNMTIDNEGTGRLEGFHWSDSVTKILTKDNDNEFAITITKQIIEFCSNPYFNYSFDTYLSNVLLVLFDKYFDSIWEYLGEGIIGDYMTFFHLKHLIGTRNDYINGREGVAFNNKDRSKIIINWCRQHSEIAPERIANMMPLSVKENNKIKWHPFSKAIIDEFGDNEKLLNELSANMGTFGSVGSSIPYYTTLKKILQELVNHKIDRVKDWAVNRLEYTEKTIKREKLGDEEHFL